MRYLSLAILIFLLTGPLHCFAAATARSNELLQFFRPRQAQVIMPVEGGILIDKGGSDHIAPGDIFVSVTAEQQLLHPQTGEQLDTHREYGALFEVTRVKADLAYCRPLDNLPQPPAGTKVRRFENIPIYFESDSEDGFQLFRSLREKLPHLLWQDYLSGSQPAPQSVVPSLVVHYSGRQLQVQDQNKRILFEQTLSADTAPTVIKPGPIPPAVTSIASTQIPLHSVVTTRELRRIALPRTQEIKALRLQDLDGNGTIETILGFRDEIRIGSLLAGKFVEKTRLKLTGIDQIIQLSVLDLDQDSRPEIVVAALKDNNPYSVIYTYDGEKLNERASSFLLLGSYSPDEATEILLGMDKDALLKSKAEFYRITLEGDKIKKTACAIPGASQVYGLTKISDAQGNSLLVQLDPSAKLKVTSSKGETLWRSGESFGGSVAYLRVHQPGSRNIGDEDKLFLGSTLKRTPGQTLLVAKHVGSQFFKNSPNYKNGQLAELRWNGFALEQIGISDNLGGRIADFDQADLDKDGKLDLIAAVVYKTKGFFSKPVSGLVIFPNLKP